MASVAFLAAALATPDARGQETRAEEPLLVLAAASLVDVLPRIAQAWEASGGVPVRFSFDATSRLAPQALSGGRADVFVSADTEWMTWLADGGGVAGSSRLIARNRLVVVAQATGPAPADPLELATFQGVLALAGENVPAGRYARRALEAAGIWDAVEPRIVRGGSVRGALEWVARGEAEVGVVYATDVVAEPRVRLAFVFPEGQAPSVVYLGAVLSGSRNAEGADAFVEFLRGSEAAALLEAAGFDSVSETEVTGPPEREGPSVMPSPWGAVRLSLMVGLLATLLGLVPAVAAGWVLARHRFPGKALLTMVILAPLVMPPVVTGFLLLSVLGRAGLLGAPLEAFGLSVPFTPMAPVLAALVVGFPLYVMAVRGAFEAVDHRFEEVSWTLGVPPRRTFFRISFPLALPGIAAGAVLAFARALGEFGATVVLAGNVEGRTRTIALAVYTLLEAPGGRRTMWILVGASVVLSLAALLGYEALSRRQRRRMEDWRAG